MNEKLDKKLCKKYPKIFRDRTADKRDTAMCWGFCCGDGWYDLIDTLCHSLQWDTDKNRYPQVIADQVKEKFGELRFYFHTESNGVADDEKKIGSSSFPNEDSYISGIIEGKVSFACRMSNLICEECGSTTKAKNENINGWYRTLCSKCKLKIARGDKE